MTTLENALNQIIANSLWAPGGDQNDDELFSAALAFEQLKAHGLTVENEKEVENILRTDNIYEKDFIQDLDP